MILKQKILWKRVELFLTWIPDPGTSQRYCCHTKDLVIFRKGLNLKNQCSKIRSLLSLVDSLYAVLLDLHDFTLADEDPNSRFLYRGFLNRDVWQWYVDIDLTNEDRTGTLLLLKLLLNSALQHSSSFDAKIQNLFYRATAKGNQFIIHGICYQS